MTENKTKKSVLLIHPLGANWIKGEKDFSRVANLMVPIGLCNLAAWLDKFGHDSVLYDCYAHFDENESLYEGVRENQPDFIGISTTASSFLDGVQIAERVKEILPDVKIIFGGVHISALREKLLEDYPVIDFGVVGEGEQTLLELIESDDKNLNLIEGLLYRSDGIVVFNGFRTNLVKMDELPYPAYDKLEGYPNNYLLPIFSYPKAPNTTIITSRGCPFSCSYCDRSVFRKSYRYNSPDYMLNYMHYLRKNYNIKHVNIYDDTFVLNKKRIIEFCEKKINSRLKMTFNCAARAEQIDADLLKLMKKAGCWMISIGMETGDPELLKKHRSYLSGTKPEDALDNIKKKCFLIKKAQIRVKGLFMMGLPGETEKSIDRCMEYVFSLPLDEFNLAKFTPFPGSPLYENIQEYGEFDENWKLMNALNFVFVTAGFTRERLEERYKEFYRKYFSRPSILMNYLSMLWKSPDSWIRFIRDLPAFLNIRKSFEEK